jgi:hypothetical protein
MFTTSQQDTQYFSLIREPCHGKIIPYGMVWNQREDHENNHKTNEQSHLVHPRV